MKIRKKAKSGEESYWKSFTDIMSGLLLVILLVMMLLLLYMTQMNKNQHEHDEDYKYDQPYEDDDDLHDKQDHLADDLYDRPPTDGGGGGGEGGADDPGTSDTDGVDYDVGHDKSAVFVTIVDEETGKAIKKQGVLFELFRGSRASGNLQTLYTYYPTKVGYKQFETTPEGTFFLPEKIRLGWYVLHNTKAPKGYSFAEDVKFEVTEARDWSNPYQIIVPMSPSKSVIYIKTVDSDTRKAVAGSVFEIYAAADIVTLDGTVRYKQGDKVGRITCDKAGEGYSPKLYLGEYTLVQTKAAKYYSVNKTDLDVTLDYLEDQDKVYTIQCTKTRKELKLVDVDTNEPVSGAVFSVTDKENKTTNEAGVITLTDFDKDKSYTVSVVSLPEPYRPMTKEFKIEVDANGMIGGEAVSETILNAYIVRLTVSVRDKLFGSEIGSSEIRLYKDGTVVEEWTATGSKEEFVNLEPGNYILEVGGDKNNRATINLKDQGGMQTLEMEIWTLWDTLTIIGAALGAVLLLVLFISLIRRRKKKHEKE